MAMSMAKSDCKFPTSKKFGTSRFIGLLLPTRVFSLGLIPTRILPPSFQRRSVGFQALEFRCRTHGRRRRKATQTTGHLGCRIHLLLFRRSFGRHGTRQITVDDSHLRSNKDTHELANYGISPYAFNRTPSGRNGS